MSAAEPSISTSSSLGAAGRAGPLLDSNGASSASVAESVEVSVPTDLTVTSDADDTTDNARHRHQTRRVATGLPECDRTELLRTIELLRLQVSAREEQLSSAKVQHRAVLERLTQHRDAHLVDTIAHNDRLQQQVSSCSQETAEVRERAARELATLTSSCATLQANMNRLSVRDDEVRASLDQLEITKSEYERLKLLPQHQLNLRQYAMLRVHSLVWPLRLELSGLQTQHSALRGRLQATEQQRQQQDTNTAALNRQATELQAQVDELGQQCLTLRDQINSQDFRVQNYARVKQERDAFQEDLIALQHKHDDVTLLLDTTKKENEGLTERLEICKNQARRSENDGACAKEDVNDLQRKLAKTTSGCDNANRLLRAERDKTLDLHTKYVNLKAESTLMGENVHDLQRERNDLREKLDEITLFNTQLEHRLDEMNSKCQTAFTEQEKYKIKSSRCKEEYEAEISELRTTLIASTRHEKDLTNDNVKLKRESQMKKSEIQTIILTKDTEIAMLKEDVNRVRSSLKAYKDLEKEYEESLKALSSSKDGRSPEDLTKLFPGLCISGNKVMEQTVKLSSKVLRLERENNEAKVTITQLTEALNKLRNSLYSYKCAVSNMTEPVHSLQQTIISQEDQITSLHAGLEACEQHNNKLKHKNEKLSKDVNRLMESLDACSPQAEALRRIKNELNAVKDILVRSLNLASRSTGRDATGLHRTPLPSAITLTKDITRTK